MHCIMYTVYYTRCNHRKPRVHLAISQVSLEPPYYIRQLSRGGEEEESYMPSNSPRYTSTQILYIISTLTVTTAIHPLHTPHPPHHPLNLFTSPLLLTSSSSSSSSILHHNHNNYILRVHYFTTIFKTLPPHPPLLQPSTTSSLLYHFHFIATSLPLPQHNDSSIYDIQYNCLFNPTSMLG